MNASITKLGWESCGDRRMITFETLRWDGENEAEFEKIFFVYHDELSGRLILSRDLISFFVLDIGDSIAFPMMAFVKSGAYAQRRNA